MTIDKKWLESLKPGDQVIRVLAGTVTSYNVVKDVNDKLITIGLNAYQLLEDKKDMLSSGSKLLNLGKSLGWKKEDMMKMIEEGPEPEWKILKETGFEYDPELNPIYDGKSNNLSYIRPLTQEEIFTVVSKME